MKGGLSELEKSRSINRPRAQPGPGVNYLFLLKHLTSWNVKLWAKIFFLTFQPGTILALPGIEVDLVDLVEVDLVDLVLTFVLITPKICLVF